VFDVVVALVWGGTLSLDFLTAAHPAHQAWAVVVAVLAVAALVVRRRWPVPVFLLQLVIALVAALARTDLAMEPLVLVGLHTMAMFVAWPVAVVGALLVVAVETDRLRPWQTADNFDSWLLMVALVVAVTGVALFRAARAATVEQLEQRAELLRQRAELLEREREQERLLAISQERLRIAAEMHDVVGHHLTVMVTLAEGSSRVLAADDPAREAVGLIAVTGRDALTETRRILGVLRSEPGEHDGAPDPSVAIRAVVETVRAAGVEVDFEGRPVWDDLPADLAVELGRVMQEALTNVLKHAGPGTTVHVVLARDADGLLLTITDDGAGTSLAPAISSGSGVNGMRDRLSRWDGQVQAGPAGTGGWQVVVRLPGA
jgi:signal transduction histidine kinase